MRNLTIVFVFNLFIMLVAMQIIASNPNSLNWEEQTRMVFGFVILGSLILCVLSLFLMGLNLISNYLIKRFEKNENSLN